MTVFVIFRENGYPFESYEIYKIVYTERKAQNICAFKEGYRYEEYKVE